MGIFDGSVDGRIKFKIGSKILLLEPQSLSLYTEVEKEEPFRIEEVNTATTPTYDPFNFPSSIDLHIEKLDASYLNAQPERILSVQLGALDNYLDAAEQSAVKIITIIHGKGTGVLKAETEHRLKARESVNFYVEAHQGGAVEVWFK